MITLLNFNIITSLKKEKELRKFPRKTRFKKFHRGTLKLINESKDIIRNFYSIKTISAGFIKWKTIMETQRILKRILKKKKNKIKIKFNFNLDWPVSRKPKGTRMGKGKGKVNFDDWVARVSAGKHIIEFGNVNKILVLKAFRLAAHVLPFPCVLIKKDSFLS